MIIRSSSVVAALLALTLLVPAAAAPAAKNLMVKAPPVKLEAVASSMPIWFEPNQGQVGGRTEWTARAAGAWLFLTSNEVVYALPPEGKFDPAKTRGVPNFKTTNVHMRLVGGKRVKGRGEEGMESYSNYFVGKNEDEWFTGVPHFGRVRYEGVYAGIDLVYYSVGKNVEFDFLVEPGGDPGQIELGFDGVTGVQVDQGGDLVVSAGGKSFRQHRPRVFQGSEEIEASYRLTERGNVVLDVGEYDRLISLRVDPVLDFATYLGGPGEDAIWGIAIAPDGNPVLIGSTQSPQSPTLDPFQQPSIVALAPIVLKMAADGQRAIFYSILGSGFSSGRTIAVDLDGSIVVGGITRSADFPLKQPLQSEFRAIWDNGFVTRLSADSRSLVHSSYLGGSYSDSISAVTLDDSGNAYFVGQTSSSDFPTVNPIQGRHAGGIDDGIISKVGKTGTLLFSTFLGGTGADLLSDIRWRSDGSLIIVGYSNRPDFPLKDPIQTQTTSRTGYPNAVLAIIDQAKERLTYSTFFGGTATASASRVAVDSRGRIIVLGTVGERTFLLKNPLYDGPADESNNGFLTQFSPDGKNIELSTFLPGAIPTGICIDENTGIYIGGIATSTFPLKNSIQEFRGGGILNSDHFVMRIAPEARAVSYSTVIGGRGNENGLRVACDGVGRIYFAGQTVSTDYPSRMAYQRGFGGAADGVYGRMSDNSVPPLAPFTVSPSNLTFRYVQNDATPPPPVSIAVYGLTQTVTVQASETWVRVSANSLTTSGTFQVSIDPTTLRPGSSQATVTIAPTMGVSASILVTVNTLAPAPLISSVEPSHLGIGSADTEITLHGSGFTNQTAVMLDTNPWILSAVRIVDASTIRFVMPRSYFAAENNFSITVKNADSAISKAMGLSVGLPAPAIGDGGIVSAASFAGLVLSPGEIITIFGENFESDMRVLFNGIPAAPIYIAHNQLSVTVPYTIAGARTTQVVVEAFPGRRSVPVQISVWPARPGLFTVNSSGRGPGAILNQDGSVNSSSNPAARGTVIVLYGTGGGPLAQDRLELPVSVFIDGIDCQVLYAGVAPGLASGAIQINVRVPTSAVNGAVILRVGERESQEDVTFALK